ncbi:putative cystatin-9-like protein CST9LP1 [Lemur catta]|uniref:putative cystatin-9-like protein CST9LP1 n=1 Tax=Lemur catta TaxID=9447 RepID=UPI001E2669E0|nr:putative cystatin-9-like protein CST9LP1 [Lemur catta]
MSCLPRARALPWVLLLLLSGLQLLVTQAPNCPLGENWIDQEDIAVYLPLTVEFALHTFNQQSGDQYAYRLVSTLNSRKEQGDPKMVFSMNLLLGRTVCGKFEEDIDDCPFQKSPEPNNTLTCFFTVSTKPWLTQFELLNKTCSEGVP